MLSQACQQELQQSWLPNITGNALDRLIDMLEKGSPLLIHGSFTRSVPQGCLASHIAWNHPRTCHLNRDAGIVWLSQVVGINPATSSVIRDWDSCGKNDWEMRKALLEVFKEHRLQQQNQSETYEEPAELAAV